MKDNDIMPFGKHKGEKLGDVPARYLLWLSEQPDVSARLSGIIQYVEQNRAHLEKEAKSGE